MNILSCWKRAEFKGREDYDVKQQKCQSLRICNMLISLAKNKLLVTSKLLVGFLYLK